MLRAKVKVTDLTTGRDYLLLVAKLNLKGMLVHATQDLEPNTLLNLSLRLQDEPDALELRGRVHKMSKSQSGSRGIIIQFQDLSDAHATRIGTFIERSEADRRTPTTHPGQPQPTAGGPLPIHERTAAAELDALSDLKIQSPDAELDAVAATHDEESFHNDIEGLAGATRIFDRDEIQARIHAASKNVKKTGRWKKLFLGTLLIAICASLGWFALPIFTRFLDARFGDLSTQDLPNSLPSSPIANAPKEQPDLPNQRQKPEPAQGDSAPPAPQAPKRSSSKRVASARHATDLETIDVQDLGEFLLLTFEGEGDYSGADGQHRLNPRAIVVEFPKLRGFSVPDRIPVGKPPLLQIQTEATEKGLRAILELTPTSLPKFDVSPTLRGIEIQISR